MTQITKSQIMRAKDFKKALKNFPDESEVVIETPGCLCNVTGLEKSFFNSKDNKFLKLKSYLSDGTPVQQTLKKLTKKKLYDAIKEGVRYFDEDEFTQDMIGEGLVDKGDALIRCITARVDKLIRETVKD